MRYRLAVALALVGCGSSSTAHVDAPTGDGHVDASADAPDDGGIYAAYATIGGLDHLRVAKTLAGTCFAIDLVSPGSDGKGLTLQPNWGLTAARAMQPAATCNPAYAGPITNSFDTTAQSGSIMWSGSATPTTIDAVAVTLVFTGAPAWCPPSEALNAANVAVH